MNDSSVDEAVLPRVTPVEDTDGGGGWFARLAASRLRKRAMLRRKGVAVSAAEGTEVERAQAAIRVACVKCALTGAASAGITTTAEVLTAELEGLAAFATVPAAMLAIGGEMVVRSAVHLDLTCDIAEIFGVPFDADGTDFWRLYALAFGTADHAEGTNDPGRRLVESVIHLDGDDVAASIGGKLLGESVLRNILPVGAIATSSIANWLMTRRLGDTVQRAMRYHRAFRDEMRTAGYRCDAHRGLLAEGLWFLFTADGRLSPEETAALASLVRTLTPEDAAAVTSRFVEDDYDWLKRLEQLPEAERDDFLHALEVAATVDKVVSLPERKILRGAARVLGRPYDEGRIGRMVKQFEEVGVLPTRRPRSA
jgi:hypothetical protein